MNGPSSLSSLQSITSQFSRKQEWQNKRIKLIKTNSCQLDKENRQLQANKTGEAHKNVKQFPPQVTTTKKYDIQPRIDCHARSPSAGNFICNKQEEQTSIRIKDQAEDTQFTDTRFNDVTHQLDGLEHEIENVLIGSRIPNQSATFNKGCVNQSSILKCNRHECLEREVLMDEQQARIQKLESLVEKLELKVMSKRGKIELLKMQYQDKALMKQRQIEILQESDNSSHHSSSHNHKQKKEGSRQRQPPNNLYQDRQRITFELQGLLHDYQEQKILKSAQQTQLSQSEEETYCEEESLEPTGDSEMFDSYQKRDKMSQYKKMHINTQLADSMFPNCESDKNMADADSPVSYYKNLKLGKAGLPIPPGGGSKGLLTQRNGQVPSLNCTNQLKIKIGKLQKDTCSQQRKIQQTSGAQSVRQLSLNGLRKSSGVRASRQHLGFGDCELEDNSGSMIEMDSPTRGYQHSSVRTSLMRQSLKQNVLGQSNPNFNAGSQTQRQTYQRPPTQFDQQMVYLEDLDVFDEFEMKFKDFLKSTPYIEQILQTSKEYRMIIESLNILARFNDELKRISTMTHELASEGKKLFISKEKGLQITQKNRELRVQIKSLLKDSHCPSVASSYSGSLMRGADKTSSTKRELVKQRNFLMQENDTLLFQFKKLFLF